MAAVAGGGPRRLHHRARSGLLLNPAFVRGLGDLLTLLVGAAAIVLVTAWLTTVLIGREMPEPEFRRLVDRSRRSPRAAHSSMPASSTS